MIYFKHPPTGEVFAYEDDQAAQEWAGADLVQMTALEVADHLGSQASLPTPEQQIAALEREHQLPKVTREFMLTFMEATAIQKGAEQGLTPEQAIAELRAGNPGYRNVKLLDEQIAELRAQL